MTNLDWNTLTVMASIFAVGGTSAFWLSSQFSAVKNLIYTEMRLHQHSDDAAFKDISTRLQRLELKEFGFAPQLKRPTDEQL